MRNFALMLVLVSLFGCTGKGTLTPLPPDATVLCFGDSLTYGSGAEPGDSYPATLARYINRPVVNAGIPGETSAEALARLPGELERTRPKLLILCTGANDILRRMNLDQTADNLREMVKLAQGKGIGVVLIAVPLWSFGLEPAPFYRTVADEANIPLENKVLAKVLARKGLLSDPVHPNAAGYRKIAEAVAALLARNGAL